MAEQSDIVIYKICPRLEWENAQSDGVFRGSAVDLVDGFIHFSAAHQVRETAAKHFRGQTDLLLIAFSAERLGQDLKWEASRGGDLFPHLYAELKTDLALWQEALTLSADGAPIIPERVPSC